MKKTLLLLLSFVGGFVVFQITWETLASAQASHMLFVDITSLVAGLLLPLITSVYLFRNNSLKDTLLFELIILAFIGFVIQQSSYGDAPYDTGIFNEYLGFTLLLPIFATSMHFLYNKSYIKAKFSITIVSILLAIAIHVLNFILYPLVGGHAEQMYGIILIFGLPLAVVFGIIYAIYFIKIFFKPNIS